MLFWALFSGFSGMLTDIRTDKPSYRDARTHLKERKKEDVKEEYVAEEKEEKKRRG